MTLFCGTFAVYVIILLLLTKNIATDSIVLCGALPVTAAIISLTSAKTPSSSNGAAEVGSMVVMLIYALGMLPALISELMLKDIIKLKNGDPDVRGSYLTKILTLMVSFPISVWVIYKIVKLTAYYARYTTIVTYISLAIVAVCFIVPMVKKKFTKF